ncbi:MAG: hypothetical protein ACYSTF_07200, partial [Planctomycetota bacterium]
MKRDKRQTCKVIPLTTGVLLGVILLHGLAAGKVTVKAGKNQDKIIVDARSRVKVSEEGSGFRVVNNRQQWKPSETAIIICDMWNEHWCKGATRRVAEL